MRVTFKCQGEPVVYEYLDQVSAVFPDPELRASATEAAILGDLDTRSAASPPDDAALPISTWARQLFSRAGWMFAESSPRLLEAALTRESLAPVGVTRPVFRDPEGNILIGTEAVSVQLHPGLSEADARRRMEEDGLTQIEPLGFGESLFEANLPEGQDFIEVVTRLQNRPWYVFAEPVFLQVVVGRQAPTDPAFAEQWHHFNDGTTELRAGADIKSLAAWKLATGKGVRIAVVDIGMQVGHPDLVNGIVSGGRFVADRTGRTRFACYDPAAGFPDDPHGTFCMGMAGARWNNDVGGCGSAPEADLIALACAPDQVGSQSTLARAVAFAADPGTQDCGGLRAEAADVLACSLGSETDHWRMCSVLKCAIEFAAKKGRGGRGLPIFWSASNDRIDISQDQVCSHPDVIAVGQSNGNDIEGGGAFGSKLELLAPGVDVFSTTSGGGHDTRTGASYACPLVAGVAALVLERNPGWTRDQVRARLRESCDKVGGDGAGYGADGHSDVYGYGRINAERAVTGLKPRVLEVRGEPLEIDEVVGLLAVSTAAGEGAGGGPEGTSDSLQAGGLRALDPQEVVSSFPSLRADDVAAFREEGWTFFRSAGQPRLEAPVAKVFIQGGTQPVLITNGLTVAAETVPEDRVSELLAPHRGRILERIEFAPGLYRVEVDPPGGRDVLDVAGALEGLKGIEFAEPEFVEVIAGRA